MNTMTREVTGVEVTETMDYWYDIVTRKEYRVKVTRRVGPHQVEDQDGNLVQVTESVTFEASPPMGTPVIYIDGEKAVKADLVVEVTQTTESNGDKEYPLTITKWSGLHEIQDRQGRTVRVDRTVFSDAGPKMGISRSMIRHREIPYTAEEREEGRRNIQRVVTQCLQAQGIW